jgi:indolepyruvate ferredoxin oxidoreductase beta subunit
MQLDVILAGLGGQGVVFATRVLAHAAMARGHAVIVSETHGMSQRGGAVVSHVRVNDGGLQVLGGDAPLIRRGTAGLLLAFDADEALRNLPFLARGGLALVNGAPQIPAAVAARLAQRGISVAGLPATALALEMGAPGALNIVMLGFAAAHAPLSGMQTPLAPLAEALQAALATLSRGPAGAVNARAFALGFAAATAPAAAGTE